MARYDRYGAEIKQIFKGLHRKYENDKRRK